MMRRIGWFGGFLCLAACEAEPDLDSFTVNASFDEWCDGIPCGWILERGHVENVATWHPGDRGLGMVGAEVWVSQVLGPNEFVPDACMRFEVLADFPPGTRGRIELDFGDDEFVEYEHDITGSDFEPNFFRVRMPPDFIEVRLRAIKEGTADAVLAQLKALQDVAACRDDALLTES